MQFQTTLLAPYDAPVRCKFFASRMQFQMHALRFSLLVAARPCLVVDSKVLSDVTEGATVGNSLCTDSCVTFMGLVAHGQLTHTHSHALSFLPCERGISGRAWI